MEDSEFKKKYYKYKVRYVELKKIYEEIQNNELDINDYIEGIDDIEQIGGDKYKPVNINFGINNIKRVDDIENAYRSRLSNQFISSPIDFNAVDNIAKKLSGWGLQKETIGKLILSLKPVFEELKTGSKNDKFNLPILEQIDARVISVGDKTMFLNEITKFGYITRTFFKNVNSLEIVSPGVGGSSPPVIDFDALPMSNPVNSSIDSTLKLLHVSQKKQAIKDLFGLEITNDWPIGDSTSQQTVNDINQLITDRNLNISNLTVKTNFLSYLLNLYFKLDYYLKKSISLLRSNIPSYIDIGNPNITNAPSISNLNLGAFHFTVGELNNRFFSKIDPNILVSNTSYKSLYNGTSTTTNLVIPLSDTTDEAIQKASVLYTINKELLKTSIISTTDYTTKEAKEWEDELLIALDNTDPGSLNQLQLRLGKTGTLEKSTNIKHLTMYFWSHWEYDKDTAELTTNYSKTIHRNSASPTDSELLANLPESVFNDPTKINALTGYFTNLKTIFVDIGTDIRTNINDRTTNANKGATDFNTTGGNRYSVNFHENKVTIKGLTPSTDADVSNFVTNFVFKNDMKVGQDLTRMRNNNLLLGEYMILTGSDLEIPATQLLPNSALLKDHGVLDQYDQYFNPCEIAFSYNPIVAGTTALASIGVALVDKKLKPESTVINCDVGLLTTLDNLLFTVKRKYKGAEISLNFDRSKRGEFERIANFRSGNNINASQFPDQNYCYYNWRVTLGGISVDTSASGNIRTLINSHTTSLRNRFPLPPTSVAGRYTNTGLTNLEAIKYAVVKLYDDWAALNTGSINSATDGDTLISADIEIYNIMDSGDSLSRHVHIPRRQHPLKLRINLLKNSANMGLLFTTANIAYPTPATAFDIEEGRPISSNPIIAAMGSFEPTLLEGTITPTTVNGISVNTAGVITGTPTGAAGTTTYLNFNIAAPAGDVAATPPTTTGPTITKSFAFNIHARPFIDYDLSPFTNRDSANNIVLLKNNTYTFSPSGPPNGNLTVSSNPSFSGNLNVKYSPGATDNGELTITPNTSGVVYTITVTANNALGNSNKNISIVVEEPVPPPVITLPPPGPLPVGDPVKKEFLDLPWGTAEPDAIDELDDINYKLLFKKYRMKYLKLKKKLSW